MKVQTLVKFLPNQKEFQGLDDDGSVHTGNSISSVIMKPLHISAQSYQARDAEHFLV
jgi:hypothetical protein